MRIIELFPPAKLNLILRVLQRRRGPLHHIQSVMLTVDWTDALTIKKKARPGIDLRVEGGPPGALQANLAYRAAEAVIRAHGLKEGVSLHLRKRIPAAAGLGGGSSDAASVIKGMARLWNLHGSMKEWSKLGVKLGSDVPFFLWSGLAEVSGVGEIVSPVSVCPSQSIGVVTFPSIRIPTALAFSRLEYENTRAAGLTKGRSAIRLFHRWKRVTKKSWTGFYGYNDFATGVRARYPRVNAVWTWLEQQEAGTVGLSGKGPTLFVLGTPSDLRRIGHGLRRAFGYCQFRVVTPVRGSHALP